MNRIVKHDCCACAGLGCVASRRVALPLFFVFFMMLLAFCSTSCGPQDISYFCVSFVLSVGEGGGRRHGRRGVTLKNNLIPLLPPFFVVSSCVSLRVRSFLFLE